MAVSQFVKDRMHGLGASDAAPACELSKWKSRVHLYLEKRGELPKAANEDEDDDNGMDEALQLEMGQVLEPVTLRRMERKTGLTVHSRQMKVVDESWPTRWVTLDGIASDGGLVEAKSVGIADPREWGDEYTVNAVPIAYLAQVHHAFGCFSQNIQHAWVPVVVLNRQFRLYRVERDETFVQQIAEQEKEFWSLVIAGTPPPPRSEKDAKLLWPGHQPNKSVVITTKAHAQWTMLGKIRRAQAQLKAGREFLEVQLKELMGDAESLITAGPRPTILATWKKARDGHKFDKDSFALAHAELYREYMEPTLGARRFLYKEPKT